MKINIKHNTKMIINYYKKTRMKKFCKEALLLTAYCALYNNDKYF